MIDRNLMSTNIVCQQVAQRMMQRRRGRIITIGSVAAFKGRTNGSIYATAKAGAMHFTRCLADQMRPYGVTVNAIAPGDTRTERFLATRAVDPVRLAEDGTLDRIATVDEVARVVEFFAGPMGAFVSGQVIASMAVATMAGLISPARTYMPVARKVDDRARTPSHCG